MRYRLLSLAAVLIFGISLYVFCDKLTGMLEIGTCASGGPYEIAQPCPEGIETDFWLLTGSIFGLFAAMGVAGLRGPRPGGGGFGFGSMMVTGWALFFSITGAIALIYSQTSDTIPEDGKLGGTIVGITFLVMGVPALFAIPVMVKNAIETARAPYAGPPVLAGPGPGGEGWISALRTGSKLMKDMSTTINSGGSVGSSGTVGSTGSSWGPPVEDYPGDGGSGEERIAKLERLQRLRESGALTEAEFATEKARILVLRSLALLGGHPQVGGEVPLLAEVVLDVDGLVPLVGADEAEAEDDLAQRRQLAQVLLEDRVAEDDLAVDELVVEALLLRLPVDEDLDRADGAARHLHPPADGLAA